MFLQLKTNICTCRIFNLGKDVPFFEVWFLPRAPQVSTIWHFLESVGNQDFKKAFVDYEEIFSLVVNFK